MSGADELKGSKAEGLGRTGRPEAEMFIGDAQELAQQVTDVIAPFCRRMMVAGSVRRQRDRVHDVDIVVELDGGKYGGGVAGAFECRRAMDSAVAKLYGSVIKAGPAIRAFTVKGCPLTPVELYFAESGKGTTPTNTDAEHGLSRTAGNGQRANFGMLCVVRTGSKDHNIWLARYALSKGLKFAAGTVIVRAPHGPGTRTSTDGHGNPAAEGVKGSKAEGGMILGCDTEEDVFGALGLAVPAAALRELVNGRPAWQRVR